MGLKRLELPATGIVLGACVCVCVAHSECTEVLPHWPSPPFVNGLLTPRERKLWAFSHDVIRGLLVTKVEAKAEFHYLFPPLVL